MKVTVKMLQGRECTVDVTPGMTVAELKEKVYLDLKVPTNEQKLLLLGRPLSENKLLNDYGVKDGCKINLIRKPSEVCGDSGSSQRHGLQEAMHEFLLKHLPADQASRVLEHFMKEFHRSLCTLSIDDLERIAQTRLQEVAPMGHSDQ